MDRLIYTAMSGANAAANRQSVLAGNLANASTNGFRAQLATYRAVPVRGDGATTRVMAEETTAGHSNTPGPAIRTDRNLDAMAIGNAWFAVQNLQGNESYTRNGQFEVSSEGTLTSSNGLSVLSSDGAPITIPPGAQVSMGQDGTISAKVGDQPANIIARLKLVTPTAEDPLKRNVDGLFTTLSGDDLDNDATARIQTGALEGSNVNSIETMVSMIQAARQFESQMRLLQSAETNERSADKLLSLQG
jgi:flagellar basal-body rod protein FlgF